MAHSTQSYDTSTFLMEGFDSGIVTDTTTHEQIGKAQHHLVHPSFSKWYIVQ